MISLTKSLALIAKQASQTAKNLAFVFSCCDAAKIINVNDERLVAIFNDNSMLVVNCLNDSDESQHELSFKIDFDSSFVDFVVLVDETYKAIELADDFDSLEELYSIVEDFSSNQNKLFDLCSNAVYENSTKVQSREVRAQFLHTSEILVSCRFPNKRYTGFYHQ